MGNMEFLPDQESRVRGRLIWLLDIAPLDSRKPVGGPCELVRLRGARHLKHYAITEAGSTEGFPGVRLLGFWPVVDATVRGPEALQEAKTLVRNGPIHMVAASARRTGGLALTTCIGLRDLRKWVQLPDMYRFEDKPPLTDVAATDMPRGQSWSSLVDHHLESAQQEDFDPHTVADPTQIDMPLVALLKALPEACPRA